MLSIDLLNYILALKDQISANATFTPPRHPMLLKAAIYYDGLQRIWKSTAPTVVYTKTPPAPYSLNRWTIRRAAKGTMRVKESSGWRKPSPEELQAMRLDRQSNSFKPKAAVNLVHISVGEKSSEEY